jgi:hypothetical protein
MRRLASFLLFGFALAAGATEVWRWTDENGVVHLSDRPVPGAERLQIRDSAPSAPPARPASTTAPVMRPTQPRVPTVAYTSCAVTSPENDTVFQQVDSVFVSVAVQPALQDGHGVQVVLNGAAVADWPTTQTSHTLTGLFRGTYTVGVRIVDTAGRSYCNGPTVSFHIRQASILSPARRQ